MDRKETTGDGHGNSSASCRASIQETQGAEPTSTAAGVHGMD